MKGLMLIEVHTILQSWWSMEGKHKKEKKLSNLWQIFIFWNMANPWPILSIWKVCLTSWKYTIHPWNTQLARVWMLPCIMLFWNRLCCWSNKLYSFQSIVTRLSLWTTNLGLLFMYILSRIGAGCKFFWIWKELSMEVHMTTSLL